jgi:TM2 domain-containing membrane protein YozV
MSDYKTKRKSPDTAIITGDFAKAFDAMKATLLSLKGKIKKDSQADGFLEASWRYGINPWGMRVKVQFRDIGDGQTEMTVKGAFKDSFDTTGVARDKGIAVLDSFLESDSASKPSDKTMEESIDGAGVTKAPKVGSPGATHRGKEKKTAALLSLFLGGLGVHRFYIGAWGWGLVYIGVNLLIPGIGVVGGVVEGVLFFRMSEQKFDEDYNYGTMAPFKW